MQRHFKAVWESLARIIIVTLILSGCGITKSLAKIYHVGVLSGMGSFASAVDGFKSKMIELGYVEGKNISYDIQSTEVDIEAYKNINEIIR